MSTSSNVKGRVLIGEDVRVIAFMMTQVLESAGYAVEVAGDGESCLQRALETAPDLVVLDIMMPKMHGIEVLKALREDHRTARIGVMICTAKDFKTEHDEAARLGVSGFLAKPVKPVELLEKVDAFFSEREGANAQGCVVSPPTEGGPAETIYAPKLDTTRARFALWGTRGSIPTLGGRFVRSGGNTSCMSVVSGEEVFIFDAGTGIRDLGLQILATDCRKLHLFITHTHWDHIQGFPFFAPAYVPGFHITIYGVEGFGKDLKSVFRGQLDSEYFPVQMEDMLSDLEFSHLADSAVEVGSARVSWTYSQHPGATVAYKIEVAGKKIAWVPDNEFLQGYTGAPGALTIDDPLVQPYAKMIEFLTDADVVIHEAQYTNEEYPKKIRWGHSSVSNACALMKFARVRRWIVTHHDPMHDDQFLESKLSLTRQILEDLDHPIRVSHGYDGRIEYF